MISWSDNSTDGFIVLGKYAHTNAISNSHVSWKNGGPFVGTNPSVHPNIFWTLLRPKPTPCSRWTLGYTMKL